MTKHQHFLRELSKFGAGLIAGDFLFGLWAYTAHMFPINFLGASFTESMAVPWMVFDLILMGLLIHYGWKAEIHAPSIHQKTFFRVIGVILGVVSLLHLVRLLFGIPVNIGGWEVPFWLSWGGTLVAAYLSYESFHFGQ